MQAKLFKFVKMLNEHNNQRKSGHTPQQRGGNKRRLDAIYSGKECNYTSQGIATHAYFHKVASCVQTPSLKMLEDEFFNRCCSVHSSSRVQINLNDK
ncbi:unnamed protein product [Cuscuta campestris]|uniref:Uncharacterized protein n=1 Tax=Cuscuta campestris TaxID=132261 RepID=A0A484L7D3_9ASTE|nr:unnamed protein product [Cuscuta campestris]